MDRLIIHLGLAKAASKTLQTSVLPYFPGFNGDGDVNAELARSLGSIYLDGERHAFRTPYMLKKLHFWVQAANERQGQVVLSLETLSRWCNPLDDIAAWPVQHSRRSRPRRGQHPVVVMLGQLQEVLPTSVKLHTVLVLRNQTDWLGSLAAQVGIHETTFVHRLIGEEDASLDYYSLVKSLEGLRGPTQHNTYFLEMGIQGIAEDLARSFAPDLGHDPNWPWLHDLSRSNERRVDKGKWAVSTAKFKPVSRRGVLRRTWLQLKEKLPRSVTKLSSDSNEIDLTESPPSELYITEAERDAIRSHCWGYNSRLSQHLGVDLKSWGY